MGVARRETDEFVSYARRQKGLTRTHLGQCQRERVLLVEDLAFGAACVCISIVLGIVVFLVCTSVTNDSSSECDEDDVVFLGRSVDALDRRVVVAPALDGGLHGLFRHRFWFWALDAQRPVVPQIDLGLQRHGDLECQRFLLDDLDGRRR